MEKIEFEFDTMYSRQESIINTEKIKDYKVIIQNTNNILGAALAIKLAMIGFKTIYLMPIDSSENYIETRFKNLSYFVNIAKMKYLVNRNDSTVDITDFVKLSIEFYRKIDPIIVKYNTIYNQTDTDCIHIGESNVYNLNSPEKILKHFFDLNKIKLEQNEEIDKLFIESAIKDSVSVEIINSLEEYEEIKNDLVDDPNVIRIACDVKREEVVDLILVDYIFCSNGEEKYQIISDPYSQLDDIEYLRNTFDYGSYNYLQYVLGIFVTKIINDIKESDFNGVFPETDNTIIEPEELIKNINSSLEYVTVFNKIEDEQDGEI
jgi:hypothetical protein